MSLRISIEEALELAAAALIAAGAAATNAGPVADSIVAAQAQGLGNVGFGYLPTYCRHLEIGRVDGLAVPTHRLAASSALVADAAHGFSQPAFAAALGQFVKIADRTGIASLAIVRSYPAGMVGWFVEQLARHGLVGLAFANAGAAVSPWGGRTPVFGTNPIAFAAPWREDSPVVVDMATSATARVNVKAAAEAGQSIPADWAFDREGRPTTDALAALAGSLAPLGGHKGYCLSLMVEVLAAGVTGANWSFEAPPAGSDSATPPEVGQLLIAMSPRRFGVPHLEQRLDGLAAEIAAQGARLPGARRHEARAAAERDGLVVSPAMRSVMDRLGWR